MTPSTFRTIPVWLLASKIGSGKTPSGGAKTYLESGVTFLRSQNVHIDGLRLDDVAFIDRGTHAEMRGTKVRPDDVLLNITGASLGRVARFPASVGAANVNQHVCIIRPASGTDSRFLAYALASQPVQQQISSMQVGGNREGLNFEQVGHLRVPEVSAGEQRRIADFLDAETARIDRISAARTSQMTQLDELISAEFTETLVPGCLANPAGQWPWSWLPEKSERLEFVRLGYVARLQNGLTVDSKRDVSGDVVTRPYLRVANVQAGHLELDSVTEITVPRVVARRSTLQPGDVLMTEGGDLDKLGRATVWQGELRNCLHQNHIFAIRPDKRKLDGQYLAYVTQTLHGRCYFESTGTKTTNLASTNSSKIQSFPIPLPSVDRQRQLVRVLKLKLDRHAEFRGRLDRQLALLGERRQALITAAVTGQLDVTTAGRAAAV
ncbi:restriction endonuclease subunit S [Streptomyces sp. NPDC001251]